MANLISNLQSFNRKERFYLVGRALDNPTFLLGERFRNELGQAFDLVVPKDAFAAMDYHLDWVYASLFLAVLGAAPESPAVHEKSDAITATQEDSDLIVAFDSSCESPRRTHILFLEAKLDFGWTNSQFGSKIERLKRIFGKDGDLWPGVQPHFGVLSPKEPSRKLCVSEAPDWMRGPQGKLVWIPLQKPHGLRKVTRCNEGGSPDRMGRYWKTQAR